MNSAACSCGQLQVSVEGDPMRIALCHCLACQRRTGAVISNQARFRRDQVAITGNSTKWMRKAESGNAMTYHFLSDVWLDAVLGERRLPGNSQYRNWQLRRPTFSAPNHRGMGAVTSPVGFLTAQHAAKARYEARIATEAAWPREAMQARVTVGVRALGGPLLTVNEN
jgi:hypothetical protein